jgi:hypothetical protein
MRRDLARAPALYPLAALLLLVALSLMALPAEAEDGRWLRAGSVMVAVGLATWLRPSWLLAALVILWATPSLARVALGESNDMGWVEAVELAGLLVVGLGARMLYEALRPPASRVETPIRSELALDGAAGVLPEPASVGRCSWPGAVLGKADAIGLLRRLQAIDDDVIRTGRLIRAARGLDTGFRA